MIVVELAGGLGNQMFEYALGRHLAILNGCDLKLDLSRLKRDPLRDYSLNCFNIVENFAQDCEVRVLKYGSAKLVPFLFFQFVSKILGKLNINSPFKSPNYVSERSANFSSEILELKGNVFLSGYWQTEKYFSSIRKILMDEFSFKAPPDADNLQLIERIRAGNAVSVHIRRGDYISNPSIRSLYCCCDEAYYQRAIAEIVPRVSDPHFFVFSDDPEWVSENFATPGKMTVVNLNKGDRCFEDMRLMSLCQHNIIANSSFSWWGAWLNENPGKVVIAPKNWFNSEKLETEDLIPETWLKL